MEKVTKFFKNHAVLLGGVLAGVVLSGITFALVAHTPRGDFRPGMEKMNMQEGCMGEESCMRGKEMMQGPGKMGGPGMMGNPEQMEARMQAHICQSGSLQSGFDEQVLIGIDMKINNLELIKKNMISMAERTNTGYVEEDMKTLDELITRFDAQRKVLEANPESFCTQKETWETLNKDLRELMMSVISGQVNQFDQQRKSGKGGGMMGWFRK